MTAEDLRQQAVHCRGRAGELREAASKTSDMECQVTLLSLSAGYDSRAEALEHRLGPQPGRWDIPGSPASK